MAKTKLVKPARSNKAEAWIKQELKEQKARYKKIAQAMNVDLAPQREIWYAEFEARIQTRGFNTHADIRRRIKSEELYPRLKRKAKVVF
ncbi:MAG: hypothetical protein HYR56_09405 [Acidobacteria bacterium]|nr:hypothetical protein [Acidobacteriota bacterium]MBI3428376.1 hypothetical protein [Acidobacteriota bacterium]